MHYLDISGVEFIRLGRRGEWARRCLEEGVLELGYPEAEHSVAAAGRWGDIATALAAGERSPAAARRALQELQDFYSLAEGRLWVTLVGDRVWWARAHAEVLPIIEGGRGARLRRTRGGWRCSLSTGEDLTLARLPTDLALELCLATGVQPVRRQAALLAMIEEVPPERAPPENNLAILRGDRSLARQLAISALIRAGWREQGRDRSECGAVVIAFDRAAPPERLLLVSPVDAGLSSTEALLAQLRCSWRDHIVLLGKRRAAPISAHADPRVLVWDEAALAEQAALAGLSLCAVAGR